MNEELLRPYIREVTDEDRKLPRFSYSRIEQFLNCPMAYDFKYNKHMYSKDTSLALELGSLLHAVLERKGHMLVNKEEININTLDKIISDGIIETDEKTKEPLLGINALKSKYWEIWSVPDSEGRTYNEKIELFHDVLIKEMQDDDDWYPYAFEMPFEIVWDDRVILNGFIDRIDTNGELFRVIDYKTSKKVFSKDKLPTSLQFGIYNLAILNKKEINQLAYENIYRFILLDDEQRALTKGWEKRLIKKLTQIFDSVEAKEKSNKWEPKPSPLCYWCYTSGTNPDAHEFKGVCEYNLLWTPTNKTFEKKKEWNALEDKETKTKRQLIF